MHNDETNNDLNATAETGGACFGERWNEEPEHRGDPQRTHGEKLSAQPLTGHGDNRNQWSTGRSLSRDKSKSLFVLVGVAVVLLLVFFGLFSSPKKRTPLPGRTPRPSQSGTKGDSGSGKPAILARTVAPMLSADVRSSDPATAGQVTPEDVGRTSRNGYTAPADLHHIRRDKDQSPAGLCTEPCRFLRPFGWTW